MIDNKKIKRSLLMAVLILSFMCSITGRAEAEGVEGPVMASSLMEGVLVVDVSKSMLTSDPNKISNEAMKKFIDMS